MGLLNKILGFLALIAGIFGFWQKRRADDAEHEATHQADRADATQAHTDTLERVNEARSTLQEQHRQEQIDVEQEVAAGSRDHFDNNG